MGRIPGSATKWKILRACIHRGGRQIGGSCVEVEARGRRILIDLGLPLDADENESQYLPNTNGLDGADPTLLGVLISHPHLDHFGLLAHVSPKIPVGMGPAARRILKAAAPFLPGAWATPARGWDYQSEQSFDIGPFRVTPFLVDHSAYDAYALLIESNGESIFYSGDFRAHGRKAALFDRLIANPPTNINALLLEGSSIGRIGDDQQFSTESDIEAELVQVLSAAEGLAMVHTSGHASPVDLKRFAVAVNPRKIVPIHSFAPERYSELFSNVRSYNDGEWWEMGDMK